MASDLALLFAACESIWLGSPLCIPYASQYASRAKLRLLLYGCDDTATPHRPLENGKLVFSVIGSVEPRKGQDVFLNALGCLPDELRRKAVFRIIGSPLGFADSQAFYKKIQATAGRYPEVELIPDVPPDRLQALYSETDVVVSPSRDDPMPIVVTQGLMFSAVCLCSSAIGHAQLLEDGKSGLIFTTGSAEMLAEKMTWAILNPDALNSIGKAGRETYEKSFEMDGFMENISFELICLACGLAAPEPRPQDRPVSWSLSRLSLDRPGAQPRLRLDLDPRRATRLMNMGEDSFRSLFERHAA